MWIRVFVSPGYIPRSGVAGLGDNSIFNLLRNYQAISGSDGTILHCHLQGTEAEISPHLC